MALLAALALVLGAEAAQATTPAPRTADAAQATASRTADAATPRWPGHQPGKVILGMSCGTQCPEKERQLGQHYGVHRQFSRFGDWTSVGNKIRADHNASRLPWISVSGPQNESPAGWRALASGAYDSQIRALARVLKANPARPVVLTFHHEPSGDGTEAEGADWAAANNRFHDVLKADGALANVAFAPILGDWLFNPINRRQDPVNWARVGVLQRASFLGIDLYENDSGQTFAERLPHPLRYLEQRGFGNLMLGIGETAATDALYPANSAVEFINKNFTWAENNTARIGVISYFNSTAFSRPGAYWPLDESTQKLNTFRRWLDDPQFVS